MTNSIDIKKGGLSMRAALALCEEKGKPMSKMGLYLAGIRHGFHKPGEKYDETLLTQYLDKIMVAAPEGWKSIKEASDILQIPISTIYWWCNNSLVKSQSYGPGDGIKYVELAEVQKYNNDSNTGCVNG